MPKTDFDKDIPKMEKRVQELEKGLKELSGMQKKKYAEFETLNGALHEGAKEIQERLEAFKKEINEFEKTFEKMDTKLDSKIKELVEMASTASNLKRSMMEEKKAIEGMEKDLSREGGDLKNQKELASTLKSLKSSLSDGIQNSGQLEDEPKNLPKRATQPKLPKL